MFETADECRHVLCAKIEASSRYVDIVSDDLLPSVLNNDDVVTAFTRLARRGRQTRIRLLLKDFHTERLVGHKLIGLARRLTTALEIHVLSGHPEWPGSTWILCDRSEGLSVKSVSPPEGSVLSHPEAKRLSETFDRLWLASHETPELRVII